MKKSPFDIRFLDYIDGTMSFEDQEKFLRDLAEDTTLLKAFEEYQHMISLEAKLRKELSPSPALLTRIMADLDDKPHVVPVWSSCMAWMSKKQISGGFATAVMVCLCVMIVEDWPGGEGGQQYMGVPVVPAPMVGVREVPADVGGVEKVRGERSQGEVAGGPVAVEPVVGVVGAAGGSDGGKKNEQEKAFGGLEGQKKSGPFGMSKDLARYMMKDEHFGNQTINRVLTTSIGKAVAGYSFGQPDAGQIIENALNYAQTEVALCKQTHIQYLSDLAAGPGGDGQAKAYLGCIRKYNNNQINSAQTKGQSKGLLCQAITVCQNDDYLQLKQQPPQIQENQRILTQTDPMSTFSIDVDTGSYTTTRNLINHGSLPDPTAVRIEEMVNYFNYTYPNIDRKPFGVSYEIAPSPFNEGRHLLRIGVATTPNARAKSWNLVFLVDVSGSMADTMKLDLIKRSLRGLVDKMKEGDTVAIVTYAGDARVALQPTSRSELDKILIAINSLSAGGGTNGADGIRTAYQLAHSNMKEGSVNRVILATDGDFNIGITSDTELLGMIEQERERGVTLTTIGVGSDNYRESKMEQLADKGNGNYFYLDSDKEARRVFDERLMSMVEVVAKDVKLQIEFNPAHVLEYRLIGYDNRILKNVDFKNDKVDAGELGSGHTVTAVYEVTLNNSPVLSQLKSEYRYQATPKPEVIPTAVLPEEFAFLKIRFKQPEGTTSEELQFPLLARDIRDSFGQGSKDFQFTTAVLGFGSLLRESNFKGSARFEQIIEIAQANVGADLDGERREFVELVKSAGAIKGNLR